MRCEAYDVAYDQWVERSCGCFDGLVEVLLAVLEHERQLLLLVDDLAQLHQMRVREQLEQTLHLPQAEGIVERWTDALEALDRNHIAGGQMRGLQHHTE